jgi:hypothetical protein
MLLASRPSRRRQRGSQHVMPNQAEFVEGTHA